MTTLRVMKAELWIVHDVKDSVKVTESEIEIIPHWPNNRLPNTLNKTTGQSIVTFS